MSRLQLSSLKLGEEGRLHRKSQVDMRHKGEIFALREVPSHFTLAFTREKTLTGWFGKCLVDCPNFLKVQYTDGSLCWLLALSIGASQHIITFA